VATARLLRQIESAKLDTSPESIEVLDNGEVKLALGMSKTDPTGICTAAGPQQKAKVDVW
jgi:hypothetical protein